MLFLFLQFLFLFYTELGNAPRRFDLFDRDASKLEMIQDLSLKYLFGGDAILDGRIVHLQEALCVAVMDS